MAQSAELSKNQLNISPFWEKASAEPPLVWSKWAPMFEMAVFAKERIEVRNLQRNEPPLVKPTEPIYELVITEETESQKKKRKVRNEEKRVGRENHVVKAREKENLCNSFRWDEADAKVRSYIFLCFSSRGETTSTTKETGP